MSITKYKAVIAVAKHESLKKASEEMGYSQPGVSHMLSSLEQEFGFQIFYRIGNSLKLTDNGEVILQKCKDVVKSEESLMATVHSISGLVEGNINIAALNSMLAHFVPEVTSNFLKAYSNIQIKMVEKSYGDSIVSLMGGTSDIAFTSRIDESGIEFNHLFNDPIVLVVNEKHPFMSYDKIPVSALKGCDFIMPLPGWDDLVTSISSKYPISPNVRHYVASDTAAISLVQKNLGVYIISKLQANNLPDGVVAKEFTEGFTRELGYAVKTMKNMPPSLTEYIKVAKKVAKDMII